MEKSLDRIKVLEKIAEYEKQGIFDKDVEDDAPAKELLPSMVDYKRKKLSSKIKTLFSYFAARKFLKKIIKDEVLIIDDIIGAENLKELKGGAVVIANHFNPLDSFLLHLAYESAKQKKRKMYRVINEANYTSFPGFYGFLMRNFYTLPLSSNKDTMKNFLRAVNELLKEDQLVLVYAEQAMWWNYEKPRPLKKTAFKFAASNNVPAVPIFITMKDTDKIGPDGFNLKSYTINIGKPIYPKEELSANENASVMMEQCFRFNKETYENYYGKKLAYDIEDNTKLPEYVLRILNEK